MKRPGTAAWRPGLTLGLAGAIAAAILGSAGTAFAYFGTTDSSHPAQAAAVTLSAPGAGSRDGGAKPDSVSIKWSAPTGYSATGYAVLRCNGSACTDFTAITSGGCSGTITKTSCTDNDQMLSAGATYSYEVEAGLDSWVSPADAPFPGKTAAATSLLFTGQPTQDQQIPAAGTGTFNVSVAIQDAGGTTASHDSTDTVTLAIDSGHNPGPGTLTCTSGLTVTVSSGVANFKKCAIDKAGAGYQLTASSVTNPSLSAPANAAAFTITAGNVSQITATSGGGQSAPVTTAFANPLVATVQDVNGNPVPGIPVTFTAPPAGASATFAASGCTSSPSASGCVATTGSNGQAASSALTAGPKTGSYTISASASGAGKAVTFSEANVAGAAISSLTTADHSGAAGKIGAGDTITITFSGQLDASTVCSAWTNGSTALQSTSAGSVVAVDGSGAGGDDLLKFTKAPTACGTFNFGTIDLGSSAYYSPPGGGGKLTFSGSTIAYDGTSHTLQITLGTMSNAGTENAVTASALALNLSSNVLDTAENALAGYTYTTAPGAQF